MEEQRSAGGGKPFAVSREEVAAAWLAVKQNGGAPGADGVSIAEFEADLENGLYKVWNRMASGSYFPPPVRAVQIPKDHGRGTRMLGIPSVADRVAMTVVAARLEAVTEPVFHDSSFGYRPGRSQHDALAACRENCLRRDWVIDLDVEAFFDSVPWDRIIKAVEAVTDLPWVILYVKRWLAADVVMPDGTRASRDRGTPQGSPVSPVLANLFLHFASDRWLAREFPAVRFERYADDAVVHCATLAQAEEVLAALAARLEQCGVRLHPGKTQIVYCRDANRRQRWDGPVSFTFLGYEFRGRTQRNAGTGQLFDGFAPAISPRALAAKRDTARSWHLARRTSLEIQDIADLVNKSVRGWMHYYGKYNRHVLYPLLALINHYIQQWMQAKYRKLRPAKALARAWDRNITLTRGRLAHWQWITYARW
jgi:RNA-directed DNA polymerase